MATNATAGHNPVIESVPSTHPVLSVSIRRGVLLLCLVGLLVGVIWGGTWLWRRQQRLAALEAARRGDFAAAAPLLETVVFSNPGDVLALKALTQGYLAAGEIHNARLILDRWCAERPDDPQPYRLRLEVHRKEQHFDAALADALHLLRLEPDRNELPLTVAGLCFETGDFDGAERRCREILVRESGRWDAHRLLAEVLRTRGQREQAAQLFDALLQERPDDTAAMLARGALFVEMGDPQRAIPLLEGVIRLDSRRQRTGRYQLMLAYERTGRSEDARRVQAEMHALQETEVLRDALGSQPTNPDLQVRAARAWLAGPQVIQGLELLGRVLETHPNHRGAHAALAEYYEQTGQSGRAVEHRQLAAGER